MISSGRLVVVISILVISQVILVCIVPSSSHHLEGWSLHC